jgi:hypothetical protein
VDRSFDVWYWGSSIALLLVGAGLMVAVGKLWIAALCLMLLVPTTLTLRRRAQGR